MNKEKFWWITHGLKETGITGERLKRTQVLRQQWMKGLADKTGMVSQKRYVWGEGNDLISHAVSDGIPERRSSKHWAWRWSKHMYMGVFVWSSRTAMRDEAGLMGEVCGGSTVHTCRLWRAAKVTWCSHGEGIGSDFRVSVFFLADYSST